MRDFVEERHGSSFAVGTLGSIPSRRKGAASAVLVQIAVLDDSQLFREGLPRILADDPSLETSAYRADSRT